MQTSSLSNVLMMQSAILDGFFGSYANSVGFHSSKEIFGSMYNSSFEEYKFI